MRSTGLVLVLNQTSAAYLVGLCLFAPIGMAALLGTGWLVLPKTLPGTGYLLVMLVAAPILEELIFRGYLQPCLSAYLAGKLASPLQADLAAIGATSFAFATVHWLASPTPASWWVAIPSLGLGLLQVKTGKWQLCALLHSFFNLVWCLAIWLHGR